MVPEVDLTDLRILKKLDRNGRVSYRELAKQVGLSTTAVMKRVNSLIEDGVILKFIVMPSHAMIGAERLRAIVHSDGSEREDHLVDMIGSLPEVHGVTRIASLRGGAYLVWGNYIGSTRLQEFGSHLRRLTGVEEVELHSVISNWGRGGEMELKKHHLLVLQSLRRNPRIRVKELSDETGLSLRRARKLLREIEGSGAFYFLVRTNHSLEGASFAVKIRHDENKVTPQRILDWLQDTYGERLYGLGSSTTAPVSFAWFEGSDVKQMTDILRNIGNAPFVVSETLLMFLSSTRFPFLNEHKLDEMLEELTN